MCFLSKPSLVAHAGACQRNGLLDLIRCWSRLRPCRQEYKSLTGEVRKPGQRRLQRGQPSRVWCMSPSCELMRSEWAASATSQTDILNSHGAGEQVINYRPNKLDGRSGKARTADDIFIKAQSPPRNFPARLSLSDRWVALPL